jgi:putative membrane protein
VRSRSPGDPDLGTHKAPTVTLILTAGRHASAAHRAAAEGGISEGELGDLAQEKSTDPKVKDFAAMIVKDHSAANQRLQALTSSKQVSLPAGGGAAEMATKTKLEALSADSFDKSYIKSQVKTHEDTVKLLEKENAPGKDTDAKAFAQSILPTVQHHLQAARSLAAAEGVKVKVAGR